MLAIISLSTTDIKNDELLMIGRSKKLRKKNDIAFETQDFNWHSVYFPSIIAGGNIILFSHQKGAVSREGDSSREAILSNIAHWKSCPIYFVLLFHY